MTEITKRALLAATSVGAARLALAVAGGGLIACEDAKAIGIPPIPPSAPYVLKYGVGHMYNYSPSTTRRIRAALALARQGAAHGYIACLGDSNTRGTGSGTGSAGSGAMQGYNGWPVQLAALLTAAGIKAQCENFFGAGGYGGSFPSYDDRIVVSGSGITQPNGSGLLSIGGSMFNATAAGSITFTTKTACTSCDIYYFGSTSSGALSWQVDGGAATQFSCVQATTNIYKLNISLGALATHSVTINWVSGNSYFIGLDCFDATTPLLHIWNWGYHGSTVEHWTNLYPGLTVAGTSKWLPANCISGSSALQPAGVIGPALGINDTNTTNNFTPAYVAANKQTLIQSWATTTDTIMLTEGPSLNSASASITVQQQQWALDYGISNALGIPLLDENAWMGDETGAETLGLYNTDHLHKTKSGHGVTAAMVTNALLAIL